MRRPPKVSSSDPAALAAWIVETRAAVEDLYAMTLDATAKKSERRHAKIYLRAQARRKHQVLWALFAALDPAAPAVEPTVVPPSPTYQNDTAPAAG
jgi:hypothetical protein